MKLSKKHLAALALIATAMIWGAAAPIFKWSLQNVPPYTLAFLRFACASLLILPFVYPRVTVKPAHLPKLFLLSVIGILIHIAFFYVGLQLASSINVPIISAAAPIFLILGSIVYLNEKPKKKVIFGTLLSLVGVLFVVIEPFFVQGPDKSIIGNLFLLISALCMVVYTLLLKKFDLPYPPLTIVLWTFVLGAIMFYPLFVMELYFVNPLPHLDYRAFIGIFYGAVFSSTLAYLFYGYGVQYIDGSEVGIYSYLEPILTIIVALPLLGEKITLSYVLGGLVVFLGIFIAEGRLGRFHHHFHR